MVTALTNVGIQRRPLHQIALGLLSVDSGENVYAAVGEWQGYGVFLFLWQFFIPLAVFVVAYWKILAVLRHRANVVNGRERIASVSGERGLETGMEAIEQGTSMDNEDRDVTTGSRDHGRIGNEIVLQHLSRAQINVVRTMVYITVCFILCWMPLYFYYLLSTFKVRKAGILYFCIA